MHTIVKATIHRCLKNQNVYFLTGGGILLLLLLFQVKAQKLKAYLHRTENSTFSHKNIYIISSSGSRGVFRTQPNIYDGDFFQK